MSKNVLFEVSKCSIRVNQHQETHIACSNSALVILTDEGLNIFNYTYNIRCSDAKIDHTLYFVPSLKKSPATNLFKRTVWKAMKNSQMTELVLDPTLWPHNRQLMEEATRPISASWSPAGFMPHSEQVLAVLNSAGNVNIYVQNIHKWDNNLDVSSLVCKEFPECFHIRHNFETIRQSAHALATESMCWSPVLNEDKSCYFIIAQKNGCILLWSLYTENNHVLGNYLGKFDSKLSEIGKITFIQKHQNKFLLICSTLRGQMIGFDGEVVNNKITPHETHKIWEHEDQMFVKFIHYKAMDHHIIFIFNKNRHLIFQMYDSKLTLISQDFRKLNDFRITDFGEAPDGLLVTTVNAEIFKINVNIVNKIIEINITPIEILNMPSSMELYGINLTINNMIYILAMVDRKMKFRKEPDFNDVIFATTDDNLNNVMDVILNNPTHKLTDYWDCIELVRYNIHKMKKMPDLDYKQLYKDGEKDVYKLKIYLMLLLCYIELGAMKNCYMKMPETSIEIVKEKLLAHHAVKLIHTLKENYYSNGIWDGNEMEYIIGAKNYLETYCHKHKRNIQDLIKTSIVNEVNSNIIYTCQDCNEILQKYTCKNGHINMLCSLTFTPILSEEYLFCKSCGVTARVDLGSIESLCVLCDLRLFKYY